MKCARKALKRALSATRVPSGRRCHGAEFDMPIYEYQCDNCGGVFEAIQKFSDDPLTECRLCGHEGIRKLLSAPAFRLKGSGWYETDFKKDKQKNLAKKEADGGGGDSKSESKSSSDSSSASSGTASKSSGSESKSTSKAKDAT